MYLAIHCYFARKDDIWRGRAELDRQTAHPDMISLSVAQNYLDLRQMRKYATICDCEGEEESFRGPWGQQRPLHRGWMYGICAARHYLAREQSHTDAPDGQVYESYLLQVRNQPY